MQAERWLYLMAGADHEPGPKEAGKQGPAPLILTWNGLRQAATAAAILRSDMALAGRAPERMVFDPFGESQVTMKALANSFGLPEQIDRYPQHHPSPSGRKVSDFRWGPPTRGDAMVMCQPAPLLKRSPASLLERLLPETAATGVFVARAAMLGRVADRLLPGERPRSIQPGQLLRYRVPMGADPRKGVLEALTKEQIVLMTSRDLIPEVWIYVMAHGAVVRRLREKQALTQESRHDIVDDACYDIRTALEDCGRALDRVYARRLSAASRLTAELACEELGLSEGLRDYGDPTWGSLPQPYNLLVVEDNPAPDWMRDRKTFFRLFAPVRCKTAATLLILQAGDVEKVNRMLGMPKPRRPVKPGQVFLHRCPISDLHRAG